MILYEMGANESMYRITRTVRKAPWVGLAAVVKLDEIKCELKMPNGDKHSYVLENDGLRIICGEHKGFYKLDQIY
jgi:hypothetical protein